MKILSVVYLVSSFSFALTLSACNGSNQTRKKELEDSVNNSLLEMPIRESMINQVAPDFKAVNFDNRNMAWVPTGSFIQKSDKLTDSQTAQEIQVDGFWMDEHEVTNAQFALFVEATGYQTVAERALDPVDFPTVPLDMLVPGSYVFSKLTAEDINSNGVFVAGANWRHPTGPSSTIKGKENDPVVQVSYEDAMAYAKWIGKRLPTEVEWKYASRRGEFKYSGQIYEYHLLGNRRKGEIVSASNNIGFRCVGDVAN